MDIRTQSLGGLFGLPLDHVRPTTAGCLIRGWHGFDVALFAVPEGEHGWAMDGTPAQHYFYVDGDRHYRGTVLLSAHPIDVDGALTIAGQPVVLVEGGTMPGELERALLASPRLKGILTQLVGVNFGDYLPTPPQDRRPAWQGLLARLSPAYALRRIIS